MIITIQNICHVPDTVLNALHTLIDGIPTTTQRQVFLLHFTAEGTEAREVDSLAQGHTANQEVGGAHRAPPLASFFCG